MSVRRAAVGGNRVCEAGFRVWSRCGKLELMLQRGLGPGRDMPPDVVVGVGAEVRLSMVRGQGAERGGCQPGHAQGCSSYRKDDRSGDGEEECEPGPGGWAL